MSAEKLREAARLMREKAKAATGGAWEVIEDSHRGYSEPAREVSVWSSEGRYVTEDVSLVEGNLNQWRANAAHIASWHPAVALAVADLLMVCVRLWPMFLPGVRDKALVVARAYLGEQS